MTERLTALYARCSTPGQELGPQANALREAAAGRGYEGVTLYAEKMTGVAASRPELERLLGDCRAGKVGRLFVYDLSRLTRRGVADCVRILQELRELGVDVISLKEGIDFSGEMGLVLAAMLGAFAKLDYDLRREKQALGIAAAKSRNGGKCPWAGNKKKVDMSRRHRVRVLRESGASIREIARLVGCSTSTVQGDLAGPGI